MKQKKINELANITNVFVSGILPWMVTLRLCGARRTMIRNECYQYISK